MIWPNTMKVHLFKIEQFFDEQLVLNAELKYPFVNVQTVKVNAHSIEFIVNDHKVSLKIDDSGEFIQGMDCSCTQFREKSACEHVVMAAWEFRKRGYPEEKASPKPGFRFQTQSLIQKIDERDLKQFIGGYARRNPEFKQLIKLLFSHEMEAELSYEDIKSQLFKLYEFYRTKLDLKKHQRKLEFYLRTYTGIAEDLITKKDYRTACFYILSSWELWMEKRSQLLKISAYETVYKQLLKVLARAENADISPELYKYLFEKFRSKLFEEDAHPILEYDIPEMLLEWNIISKEKYRQLIVLKITSSEDPGLWTSRFFRRVFVFTAKEQTAAARVFRKLGAEKILRKLHSKEDQLNPEAFFYLLDTFEHLSKNHLLLLEKMMDKEFTFLVQLQLLANYRDYSQVRNLLYHTEYSGDTKEVLSQFIQNYTLPDWVELLLYHHIFEQKDAFDRIQAISDPKEWIHLLPHLKKDHQKDILNKIKSYCIDYARNHVGMRAKSHLESIGQLMANSGYTTEWETIKKELLDKFAYRKTLRSMDRPY